ncbi:MAG: DUF3040 domain-containing protein [Actinomycetaceae bacterium]|nr:DUF3040 domain-containing protein [Actinomycetaceae bacterium]
MALSDYERQMLEALEAQLKGEDPKFAESLAPEPEQTRMAFSPRHLVLGLIIAMLGLGTVVAGIGYEIIALGVAGAVVVWLGFMYVAKGTSQVPAGTGPSRTSGPSPRSQAASFMEKQQEAFKRRREEGGR